VNKVQQRIDELRQSAAKLAGISPILKAAVVLAEKHGALDEVMRASLAVSASTFRKLAADFTDLAQAIESILARPKPPNSAA
jgi:hypothetical protein